MPAPQEVTPGGSDGAGLSEADQRKAQEILDEINNDPEAVRDAQVNTYLHEPRLIREATNGQLPQVSPTSEHARARTRTTKRVFRRTYPNFISLESDSLFQPRNFPVDFCALIGKIFLKKIVCTPTPTPARKGPHTFFRNDHTGNMF